MDELSVILMKYENLKDSVKHFDIGFGPSQIDIIGAYFGARIAECFAVRPLGSASPSGKAHPSGSLLRSDKAENVDFNSVGEMLATIKKHANRFDLVSVSLYGLPNIQQNMILLAVNVCAPHGMVIIKQGTPKTNAFLLPNFAEVVQIEPYTIAIDKSPRNSI